MNEEMGSTGRYFITKCDGMNNLRTAAETNIWACPNRRQDPQPKEILSQAFDEGPVTLIFSVSFCKGWHGYAVMVNKPGSVQHEASSSTKDASRRDSQSQQCTDSQSELQDKCWQRFHIEWRVLFLREFGERCLPFNATLDLVCVDNTPVNKARNLQELPHDSGLSLVSLIEEYYSKLKKEKEAKLQAVAAKMPAPFLEQQDGGESVDRIWSRVLEKVNEFGKVLVACPFGSQRYNLQTACSDMDMFVVYAADTAKLLGFQPPPETIKNQNTERNDYTILEVRRFSELCMEGDPRCVETLFLHPSTVYHQEPDWQQLLQHRDKFITRKCLDKYVRDACGNKGVRLLDKLVTSGEGLLSPMPKKVCKLLYIIIRLLQNAHDIAKKGNLQVYRPDESEEKKLLKEVREGLHSYEHLRGIVERLLKEIESCKDTVKGFEGKDEIEHWLVQLRCENLKRYKSDV